MEPTPNSEHPEDPDLGREMLAMPYEPLLPIEKKLIAWSLGLGLVLLGALWWLSQALFPPENIMR
jgi:hypothetical protein